MDFLGPMAVTILGSKKVLLSVYRPVYTHFLRNEGRYFTDE